MTTASSTRRVVSAPVEDVEVSEALADPEVSVPVVTEIVAEPEAAPPAEAPVEEAPPGPDDELWPDGPTLRMIEDWKGEFGEDSIFVSSMTPTFHVVWRTLNRAEYRRLVKYMEQAVTSGTVSQAEASMNNEEAMVELCMLFPKLTRQQLAGQLAGLPSLISQEILEASAFSSLEVRQL